MRPSTVLAAIAVALACLGLAWVTTPSDPFARNAPPTPETFAIGFDIPSASGVAVSSAGLEARAERGDDGGWTLTLPTTDGGSTTWPANEGAVRSLLTDLSTQAIEEGAALSDGAGGEPLARVGVTLPEGETRFDVLDQPLGGRLPVRVTPPDGTSRTGFVPADRFRPLDAGQLAALAEPRPFDGPGVITRLAVAPRGVPAFAVVRRGGVWRVDEDPTDGVEPRLHQPTIRAVIDDLKAIRAASVVVPVATGMDAPARIDPFLTIETTSDVPRTAGTARRRATEALTVAAEPSADGLTDAIATRSAGDRSHALQVRLDPQAFPALPGDLGSLLDPVPLPWEASETAEITIPLRYSDYGGYAVTTTFERTLDGWVYQGRTDEGGWGSVVASAEQSDAIEMLLAALSSPATRVDFSDESLDFKGLVFVRPISGHAPVFLGVEPITGALLDGRVRWQGGEGQSRVTELLEIICPELHATPPSEMHEIRTNLP